MTKDKESGVLSQISFSKLALDLADWASASGNIDQVCTFYELAAGPETGKFTLTRIEHFVTYKKLVFTTSSSIFRAFQKKAKKPNPYSDSFFVFLQKLLKAIRQPVS